MCWNSSAQDGIAAVWNVENDMLDSWAVTISDTHIHHYCGGGSCSSAGRAGWLVIGRLLVQIPASRGQNWAACWSILEQDMNPKIAPDVQLAIGKGPVMSWWRVQGCTLPSPRVITGIGSNDPATPWKREDTVVTSPRPSRISARQRNGQTNTK